MWAYDGDLGGGRAQNAYGGYLGPTLVVKRGNGLTIEYVNGLPATYPGRLPVDRNLTTGNSDQVRTLTHIHGGFVPGPSDGNPVLDRGYGPREIQRVWYPNAQRAALPRYHDHGLGTTRLNVAAGLAGGYLIRDDFDTGSAASNTANPWLPTPPFEVPLVIQDRQFEAKTGAFLYPAAPMTAGGAGTTGACGTPPSFYGQSAGLPINGPWIGEYFGNEILVNGLCTPVASWQPAIYRLRLLNGCNSRFLNLTFTAGTLTTAPQFVIIGCDGGMLDTPRRVPAVVLGPGERLDVLVDLRGFRGQKLQLRNLPLPKPYASPAGQLLDVMQIRVANAAPVDNAAIPVAGEMAGGESPGRQGSPHGLAQGLVRVISLDEWNAMLPGWHLTLTHIDPAGGALPPPRAVNGVKFADRTCFDHALTPFEKPTPGSVEDWQWHNTTADTHPMHVHLVQFQVVGRRPLGTPAGSAPTMAPAPWEEGWKDTVSVHPRMVTITRVKFDVPPSFALAGLPGGFDAGHAATFGVANPTGAFVYHCHIVEHEDNDMMRPFEVQAT